MKLACGGGSEDDKKACDGLMELIVNDECDMDGGNRTRRGGHCAPMVAVAKMLQCPPPMNKCLAAVKAIPDDCPKVCAIAFKAHRCSIIL